LHVHTVLSPCGDLDMSPSAVVEQAAGKGIHILGITDHNSTRHGPLISQLAEKYGILVLFGAEVTTREETHCLAFFETNESRIQFQEYLDRHLPDIPNNPRLFGYQVVVDAQGNILDEEPRLLISALDQTLEQVEQMVHGLGGLFIPAHIDRPSYSLISQLGFVPPGLAVDALEVSAHGTVQELVTRFPYLEGTTFVRGSDAHHPDQIGQHATRMQLEDLSFREIALALQGAPGRGIMVEPLMEGQ